MLFNKTVSSLGKEDMLVLFPEVKAYTEWYSIKEKDVIRTIQSRNNSVFSCWKILDLQIEVMFVFQFVLIFLIISILMPLQYYTEVCSIPLYSCRKPLTETEEAFTGVTWENAYMLNSLAASDYSSYGEEIWSWERQNTFEDKCKPKSIWNVVYCVTKATFRGVL